MAKRGRPQISAAVRLKIISLYAASNCSLSIDAIADLLGEGGPSRETIAKVRKRWKQLPEGVRLRDVLFVWSNLEAAELPWEASHWVGECLAFQERTEVLATVMGETVKNEVVAERIKRGAERTAFTNRVARWCWRVHCLAPDLPLIYCRSFAVLYALAEQVKDYQEVIKGGLIDMRGFDAALRPGAFLTGKDTGADASDPHFQYLLFALGKLRGQVPDAKLGAFREYAEGEPRILGQIDGSWIADCVNDIVEWQRTMLGETLLWAVRAGLVDDQKLKAVGESKGSDPTTAMIADIIFRAVVKDPLWAMGLAEWAKVGAAADGVSPGQPGRRTARAKKAKREGISAA